MSAPLQAALAAEYEGVFAYSVLGPWLSGADQQRAAADQAAHETLRDSVIATLVAAGVTPVAAAADYPAAYAARDVRSAIEVAVRVEEQCAAAWRYAFTAVPSTQRAAAQAALTASAVRAAVWRRELSPDAPTVAFPGL